MNPTPDYNLPSDLPPEVTGAANLVADWMKSNGHTRWELMEICSRNHAAELETARHELSMIAEDVEAYRTDCSTPTFQMVRNMKGERDQLRAEVERLKSELATEKRHWVEDDRDLNELIEQRDQWRAVAERFASTLNRICTFQIGPNSTEIKTVFAAYEKQKGQP